MHLRHTEEHPGTTRHAHGVMRRSSEVRMRSAHGARNARAAGALRVRAAGPPRARARACVALAAHKRQLRRKLLEHLSAHSLLEGGPVRAVARGLVAGMAVEHRGAAAHELLRAPPHDLGKAGPLQQVLEERFGREQLLGEAVGKLGRHLVLPLEEEAVQRERAPPAGLDGLEDELEGDQVGEVADDGAARREGPRALVHEPREHLDEAEGHPEPEARVDEEGELRLAAPLEEVDQHALLAHEAAHLGTWARRPLQGPMVRARGAGGGVDAEWEGRADAVGAGGARARA